MKQQFFSLFLSAMMLVTLSCSQGVKYKGPDDGRIAGAVPIELGSVLDDRVGADEDDTVDWKFFEMPYDDNFYCAIFFDNNDIDATITLYSGSGTELLSIKHNKNLEFDNLVFHLKPGKYYIKIKSNEGGSVYSMKCGTGDLPANLLGGGNTEPLPE